MKLVVGEDCALLEEFANSERDGNIARNVSKDSGNTWDYRQAILQ
jgi:hypothetical protein